MAIRVLLVEKDATTSDLLVPSLERKGYRVTLARNRRQALSRARSLRPDILVIDVSSFGHSGYDVMDAVQSRLGSVPTILFLEKGRVITEGQAAAFVTPPFTSRKLLYRLRKLAENLVRRRITLGPLVLDPDSRTLSNGDKTVQLRPKEAELLAFFMRNPGKVLSRQEVMRKVWDTDYVEDTRTLNVHVCWLRQKIEEDASAPRLLRTVRGLGYRFDVPGRGG